MVAYLHGMEGVGSSSLLRSTLRQAQCGTVSKAEPVHKLAVSNKEYF